MHKEILNPVACRFNGEIKSIDFEDLKAAGSGNDFICYEFIFPNETIFIWQELAPWIFQVARGSLSLSLTPSL